MARAPCIVLVDDGELRSALRILSGLELSFAHLRTEDFEHAPVQPETLLVTSARAADRVPVMQRAPGRPAPLWVCVHDQDFMPLRERLRGLGVHYLIHAGLDTELMRLFFLQLLFPGERDRRTSLRLPIQADVRYRLGPIAGMGRLEELSRNGCRLVVRENVTPGTPATVWLPASLAHGQGLELSGEVRTTSLEAVRSGRDGHSVIVIFEGLSRRARAQVEAILSGNEIGTRITPLGAVDEADASRQAEDVDEEQDEEQEEEQELTDEDRRIHPRSEYPRQLNAVSDDPTVLFGLDLSMTGLRIAGHARLKVGSSVRVALYGRPREEPLVLGCEVVRDAGEEGLGLRFGSLDVAERAWLERLLRELPPLELLVGAAPEGKPIVVSKLVEDDPGD